MQNEVFILDSNIWISYVITKRLDTLVTLIHHHQLTVLTSQNLIAEIQGVLSRPKFKKYLKHSDIKELIAIHLKLCRLVGTDETTNQLTDPKDNFLLNLYNKGKATVDLKVPFYSSLQKRIPNVMIEIIGFCFKIGINLLHSNFNVIKAFKHSLVHRPTFCLYQQLYEE